jgi:coproporphyrinogen III oxidase-like Fe-S oxidoreductase
LDEEDAENEFLSLGLRTSSGVSEIEFEKLFGRSLSSKYGEKLKQLTDSEFISNGDGIVRVTAKGFLLLNSVIQRLLF